MNLVIEGWEPTPLEKSLIDGTFSEVITEDAISDIPADLMEVQEFEVAMEELKNEMRKRR